MVQSSFHSRFIYLMCGIAGWLFTKGCEPTPEILGNMTRAIKHRGPDDEGYFRDAQAGLALGHRRLSIIDLTDASHQPMSDASTGIVLIYNGELYNYKELRQTLIALGHIFHSTGDTEVVLLSFKQWGIDCLTRFAGMFAVAIWDPRSGYLHLARDATGMKPLYIHETATGVAFGSEIKVFLQLPGFVARLDPVSIQQYLEFGYVFDERRTTLKGVEKIAPGQHLRLHAGKVVSRTTWFTPPAPDLSDPREQAARVEELSSVLEKVVAEHLMADVPVGLLLSGGLDSSVIAAMAARQGPLTTICMGFENSPVDERANARLVAEHVGSRHIDILISAEQVRSEIKTGAWVFDDLFADWGTISTRLLYRRCLESNIKVVLVGEGADELFGGYEVFNLPDKLNLIQQFRLYQRYAGRRYGGLFGEFRAILKHDLSAVDNDAFAAVRLFESRRQLPNQYVMKVDKGSMAESVEARAPYLDRRVAELAYRTPRQWLMRNGENKHLLREVGRAGGLLPEATSNRRKFGAPLAASWMDTDPGFRSFASSKILAKGSQTEQLGLGKAMRAYFENGIAGYSWPAQLSIFRNLAWRLLLLELWADHYLMGVPA
jgi:asparagine synthase (glutamine-hydrolysing)